MRTARPLHRLGATLLAAGLLVLPACSSGDEPAEDSTTTTTGSAAVDDATTTTTAPGGVRDGKNLLRVLVTNDDGVGAPGLDALVEALRQLPDTQVTVIAPAENQSGTGSKTSDTPPEAVDATTASGFPSTAVTGFPSDAVIYALDRGGLAERPHVVLSGVNQGANVGPLVTISGTIGAAKAAAARGVPALALSQGIATEPDYPSGVRYALDWLAAHRQELLAGSMPAGVESINIPTCPSGEIRGLAEVPVAADAGGRELLVSNCESTSPKPTDDVDGFANGYAVQSEIPAA